MKKALITGVTGQDGSYLAELLLSKGYEVHGIKRRSSSYNSSRVDHIFKDPHNIDTHFFMHYGDMTDASNLLSIIAAVHPDEVYNLAAQSHVAVSFETPEYTGNSDGLGHYDSSRPSVQPALRISLASIRRRPPSSLEDSPEQRHSPNRRPSHPGLPTLWPSCMRTGLSPITGKPTTCMLAMASCSTTSLPGEARRLSPAK